MNTNDSTSQQTLGRRFYDEQIALLQQKKTDELIDLHYHDDAVLISFQRIVRGGDQLKEYFRQYVAKLGQLDVRSLDQFAETEDSVFLEATVVTALGEARVYDAFVLRDGKVTHHFTGTK
jgi:hypothetical protein